jgi:hypothetical protein
LGKYGAFEYRRDKYGTGIVAWIDAVPGIVTVNANAPIVKAAVNAFAQAAVFMLGTIRQYRYGQFKYGAVKYGKNGIRAEGKSKVNSIPATITMPESEALVSASSNVHAVSGILSMLAESPIVKGYADVIGAPGVIVLDETNHFVICAAVILSFQGEDRGQQEAILIAEYIPAFKSIDLGGKT